MDKNSYPSLKQEKTVCEKIIRAIQTTSPFRAVRFASQAQIHDDAGAAGTPAPAPAPAVALMKRTPVPDRCTPLSKQSSRKEHDAAAAAVATAIPPTDRCPRVIKHSAVRLTGNKKEADAVPVIYHHSGDHHLNGTAPRKPNSNSQKTCVVAQAKPTVLPIHGVEHRAPTTMFPVGEKSALGAQSINGMFTEYIDRTGRTIRAPTNVGVRHKPSVRLDSFNDKVSDFINRAKNKFHNTPSSIDASFKENMGVKEKRLK